MIKKQPREIILSALLRMSEQAPFYIFTAFVFSYAVGTLKMPRNFILTAVMVAAVIEFFAIPISGHISDRIGRRRMFMIGAAVTGLFGFLYFGMVDTALPSAVFIAIAISLIPHGMQYGPEAAFIAESRLRRGCATAAHRSAINLRRSSPAARLRSSRPRCSPFTTRATQLRSSSPPAR